MGQSGTLSNAGIVRAALIVLVGFLASGVLGFVRTGVLSAQFGTSVQLDAFYAAQQIPEIIFVLVAGGALGSSFIPIYAQRREVDQAEAWRLASAVMTLASLAAALMGVLVAIFAVPLVDYVLLPQSTPEVQALTVNMVRLMIVTPFIFSISGLVMGILQSHGLFWLPSIAISMNSLGIIFGALLLAPIMATTPYSAPDAIASGALLTTTGLNTLPVEQVAENSVYGLAIGAVLSAVLHLVVQLPGLRTIRARLRPLPQPRIAGVTDVLRLMGPRVLGVAVVQINFMVNIILADGMESGSLVALRTAFMLMFFALGVIGQSVGSALFPTLSALYAADDMDGFRDRLATATRSVLFLAIPATVAFIVFAEPLVSVFERGEWTIASTQATAWALMFYATGIAGFALLEILSRAFYALADTWTPVIIGIGAMVSNIILSLIFIQFIGEAGNLTRGPFAGLALANAVTTLVEALVLWWLMRRRIDGINDQDVLKTAAQTTVAALMMGAVLAFVTILIDWRGIPLALVGIVSGGAVFFGASWLIGIEEARVIPRMIMSRFQR